MNQELKSYAQIKQDIWVLDKLNKKRDGFFVDIGAFDGITLSNTYILEKDYGWNGICLECNPKSLEMLKQNRKAAICDKPIFSESGHRFYLNANEKDPMLSYITSNKNNDSIDLKPSTSLNALLSDFNAPKEIDYISLDIEGVELYVLNSFDFDRYNVKCWTIEHNLNLSNNESVNNFLNIAMLLLKNNYLIKWHDWDLFAFKDNIEPQYIVNGVRVA